MNQPTMAHVKARMSAPQGDSSGATRLGSLVHEIMLEPEGFDPARFVEVAKVCDRSAKGRELTWATDAEGWAWAVENTEGEPIPVGGLDDLRAACGAFFRNPAANEIWRVTPRENKEISIVWKCPLSGLLMKARIDIMTEPGFKSEHIGGPWLGDIKSTRATSPAEFGRHVINHSYHGQAAHYVEGWKAVTGDELPFFYAASYKDPIVPSVQLLRVPGSLLKSGNRLRMDLIKGVAKGVVSGEWPGYEPVAPLPIPAWAEDRFEMDI